MNTHGLLHKIMLVVILALGFGLALVLPSVRRGADEQHARQALQTARALSQAEQTFFAQNGFYTADFDRMVPHSGCRASVRQERSFWACPGYDIALEEAHILHVQSTKYPQWFDLPLEGGGAVCGYEDGSPVGERLCAVVNL